MGICIGSGIGLLFCFHSFTSNFAKMERPMWSMYVYNVGHEPCATPTSSAAVAPAAACGNFCSARVERSSKCNAVLKLSCSCAGLGHPPLQRLAAETFILHWSNGCRNAMPSLCFLALVWVWAILRSSGWLRKPLFHTSQTVVAT